MLITGVKCIPSNYLYERISGGLYFRWHEISKMISEKSKVGETNLKWWKNLYNLKNCWNKVDIMSLKETLTILKFLKMHWVGIVCFLTLFMMIEPFWNYDFWSSFQQFSSHFYEFLISWYLIVFLMILYIFWCFFFSNLNQFYIFFIIFLKFLSFFSRLYVF